MGKMSAVKKASNGRRTIKALRKKKEKV